MFLSNCSYQRLDSCVDLKSLLAVTQDIAFAASHSAKSALAPEDIRSPLVSESAANAASSSSSSSDLIHILLSLHSMRYGWSEARDFQDRPSPTSRQQPTTKIAEAPSPLIHSRFLGMELDSALKTQINLALANALAGVKSADVSAEAISELVVAVSSTAAPVIRQQLFIFLLEWATESIARQAFWPRSPGVLLAICTACLSDVWSATRFKCARKVFSLCKKLTMAQWTELVDGLVDVFATTKDSQWRAQQGYLLGLCTAVKCVQVCASDADGTSSPKASSPDKDNQNRPVSLRRAASLPASCISGALPFSPACQLLIPSPHIRCLGLERA
jgi:hypothetical protein